MGQLQLHLRNLSNHIYDIFPHRSPFPAGGGRVFNSPTPLTNSLPLSPRYGTWCFIQPTCSCSLTE